MPSPRMGSTTSLLRTPRAWATTKSSAVQECPRHREVHVAVVRWLASGQGCWRRRLRCSCPRFLPPAGCKWLTNALQECAVHPRQLPFERATRPSGLACFFQGGRIAPTTPLLGSGHLRSAATQVAVCSPPPLGFDFARRHPFGSHKRCSWIVRHCQHSRRRRGGGEAPAGPLRIRLPCGTGAAGNRQARLRTSPYRVGVGFPARRRHSWLPCCLSESSVPVGLGATFATASHKAAGRNVSAKEFLSSKTVSSRVGSQLDSLPVWVYRAAMMRRCLGTAGGEPCGFGAADMHHHKPACAHLPQPVQEPRQLEDDGAVCKV